MIWYPKQSQPTMKSFCSFCTGAGIIGPHDHFLRSSKAEGNKVICPLLLTTECSFCHSVGHTAKFCDKREEILKEKFEINRHVKDDVYDTEEWSQTPLRFRRPPSTKINTTPVYPKCLVSRFAALDLDDNTSSDECSECEYSPPPPSPVEKSWATIVNLPESNTSAYNVDDLPPLIFGKRFSTVWSDECC